MTIYVMPRYILLNYLYISTALIQAIKPRETLSTHTPMASIPLLRLLLLLLPLPLQEHLWPSHHRPNDAGVGAGELHPIFVVPGASCSNLEAWLTDAYQPSVPSCAAR
ncbi:Os02g0589900 [Oryza sativa Japonica Group]|uniref:Os02g0589900 protein n=1 Tax=Oryza sativa subsp. japonica TaxID=39947 RepID=A0A0N7KFK8_ORYSJ|nr:hypothetical protein EE612_012116 [Oryza sativa]BAS79497.1 Os02g0589900 [Oryza sativa Japonica Group]